MFHTRQTILASRPAAMVLALTLVAALATPFVMLPHANAAPPSPACTQGNYNGCTELSPTPPEDIPAVPPNMMLMLDDSGSMDYDYLPDWDYLTTQNQWGQTNPDVNAVYYNPTKIYTPPPYANGTNYPDSPGLTGAYRDGFTDRSHTNDVRTYTANNVVDYYHQFRYGVNLPTTLFNPGHDYGDAVWGGASAGGCPSGYYQDPNNSAQCIRDPVAATEKWTCNSDDYGPVNYGGDAHACRHNDPDESGNHYTWYHATDEGLQCPNGTTGPDANNLCNYSPKPPTPPTLAHWTCPSGGLTNANAPPPPSQPPKCTANGSRIYVYGFMYMQPGDTPVQAHVHFVVPNGSGAPVGGWCSVLYPGTGSQMWNGYHTDPNNCVDEDDDTSGKAAPTTYKDANGNTQPALAQNGSALTAGQNVANWFSYYRTRMLMTKSGLMRALIGLPSNYRFGFASINGNNTNTIPTSPTPYAFDDSSSNGGKSDNILAVVQPFGDGMTPTTQKAQFWTWLASASAGDGTPLRKALSAVGQYYQTAQPWTAMAGDPGYTGSPMTFACRASYTILTTDGFWNGDNPGVSGMAGASNVAGPVNTVPAGNPTTQYLNVPPFSGGLVADGSASLADVATYYWENDLQPGMPNEVSQTSDPATWQHMTTYTIGLGVDPRHIQPPSATIPTIIGWARAVDGNATPNPTDPTFQWPTPLSNDVNNIADLAHAAVNGRGNFFSASSPEQLAAAFGAINQTIGARSPTTAAAVNSSVLTLGAVTYLVGYDTSDWHGKFQALSLKTDGTVGQVLWDAGAELDAAYHSTGYTGRTVYTGAYTPAAGGGTYSPFQFNTANDASLDATEIAGLQSPASAFSNDTLDNRIKFLLGDNTYEGSTTTSYRARTSILGAIIHSEPVYVAGATGNYYDSWPNLGVTPPEANSSAQTFDSFAAAESTRPGMVYVGANDGMLHAFYSPVPSCTGAIDASGNCSAYTSPAGAGKETWAFVPRAIYANLGNLTENDADGFRFRPTVDAAPVTRDVFFSGDLKWHTLLAGGVGLGGRGVYALDITNPTAFSSSDVLWEFDSDMATPGCVSNVGSCNASDLGYTVSKPNIGRLANGKWVVLVSNGYFPDCTTPDTPTNDTTKCNAIAADAPKDSSVTPSKPYSALFVLDAETGKVYAELKTPTGLGVTSFGLATPVMGDYNSDQVDDVAFAGDVQGNLWRFDLSSSTPSGWTVSLVYSGAFDSTGAHQGVQPITTMPRLFPDATTNRFMVVFGTGKFLGVGDNSNGTVQAVYGVRDVIGQTYTQADLQQQYLHETVVPAGQPNAGASLRCVTGAASDTCTASAGGGAPTPVNAVGANKGGWFVNLETTTSGGVRNDAGERVVVNPGAIFASNTVVFESLITGSQSTDACNPSTQGAILALDATTGGPAGVSSLGGWPIAGGRISNARTSGSLPTVSALGGGQAYLPGATLAPAGVNPLSIDAPIWRRRSWHEINQNQ